MRMMETALKTVAAALVAAFLALAPALADPLDDAKAAGLLGERPDGYLGAVRGSLPGGVAALMDDINAKRREHYESIAQKNRTTLEAVQAIVGEKVIREKVGPGEYFMDGAGNWVRK